MKKRDQLSKQKGNADLELKKIDHNLARLVKGQEDAVETIRLMAEKHPWIETEKE